MHKRRELERREDGVGWEGTAVVGVIVVLVVVSEEGETVAAVGKAKKG